MNNSYLVFDFVLKKENGYEQILLLFITIFYLIYAKQ